MKNILNNPKKTCKFIKVKNRFWKLYFTTVIAKSISETLQLLRPR